jgi:hypothetical protein
MMIKKHHKNISQNNSLSILPNKNPKTPKKSDWQQNSCKFPKN